MSKRIVCDDKHRVGDAIVIVGVPSTCKPCRALDKALGNFDVSSEIIHLDPTNPTDAKRLKCLGLQDTLTVPRMLVFKNGSIIDDTFGFQGDSKLSQFLEKNGLVSR